MSWPVPILETIVDADDLHIAPFRDDGRTPGTPTWIWCVAVGGELYVRAYHGQRSTWHRAALRQRMGSITAAERTFEVSFAPVEDIGTLARIDEAYRHKYAGSPYLAPMLSVEARSATVRIRPRAET